MTKPTAYTGPYPIRSHRTVAQVDADTLGHRTVRHVQNERARITPERALELADMAVQSGDLGAVIRTHLIPRRRCWFARWLAR